MVFSVRVAVFQAAAYMAQLFWWARLCILASSYRLGFHFGECAKLLSHVVYHQKEYPRLTVCSVRQVTGSDQQTSLVHKLPKKVCYSHLILEFATRIKL